MAPTTGDVRHTPTGPRPLSFQRVERHDGGMPPNFTAAMGDVERTANELAGAIVHETHTGIVFLIGDRAYKVKKPVLTDFLDFRTVEARERVCAHEVLLNSRLAANSYLGVSHFTGPRGGPDEPVIVMRRYPEDLRLASLIERGEPVEEQLSAIARMLANFHGHAVRSPAVDAEARAAVLAERWKENLDVLDHYVGSIFTEFQVEEVRRLAARYVAGRAALFERRIGERRIVDGHGDLIADDVYCTSEGPVLLDCLEFDDRLRHIDGLDDAAFLAMDLEFRGRADLATHFLDAYRQLAHDCAPASLAHFYVAYRAVVRAKVDCIRADQGATAAADAYGHLQLALEHLRAGTVRMVLVGGGPGSGKTTLARELGPRIGAVVMSTDDVRRELAQSGQLAGESGVYGAGRYDPRSVSSVYDAVLMRAAAVLADGQSVVLDGTWRDPRHRQCARDVAEQNSCSLVELACTVDIDEAVERIRLRDSTSHSEVTPDIAAQMYHADPSWVKAHHIDTGRRLEDSVAEATAVCCLAT
jgi:uncharacterized protein